MLYILMYHRIGHHGKLANTLQTFHDHLAYCMHYPIILPGEHCSFMTRSICLTFDDAYYDFYHFVYPLLKQLNLRVVLGVPVHYILEDTMCRPEERLSVPYSLAMQEGVFDTKAPFCTWKELKEMSDSGHVQIASHAYMHCNLTFKFVNLEKEILYSKQILEKRLDQPVLSFIYPFGKVNRKIHSYVSKHYRYSFRIGSGINFGWTSAPLCRVDADNRSVKSLFSYPRSLSTTINGICNLWSFRYREPKDSI